MEEPTCHLHKRQDGPRNDKDIQLIFSALKQLLNPHRHAGDKLGYKIPGQQ
jgi:hypothetical protein